MTGKQNSTPLTDGYDAALGIVIPMRGRQRQLDRLLPALRDHLIGRGPSNYRIVVVEQVDRLPYNRAMSLNIGAAYLNTTWPELQYLCLHDVDMLPTANVDYSYAERPTFLVKHRMMRQPKNQESLADDVVKRFHLLPDNSLGLPPGEEDFVMEPHYDSVPTGVLLCPLETFLAANGFSNGFWGWGDEDLDLVERLKKTGNDVQTRAGTFESIDMGCHLFTPLGRRWCRLNGYGETLAIEGEQVEAYWHAPAQVFNRHYVHNAEKLRDSLRQRAAGGCEKDDGVSSLSIDKITASRTASHTRIVFDPPEFVATQSLGK